MTIEIVKYTPCEKGYLLGFLSVYLPKIDLEITGMTYSQKNGKKWVGMPSREFTNEKGEKAYANIIKYRNKDTQTKFCNLVLAELEKYLNKAPESSEDGDCPF